MTNEELDAEIARLQALRQAEAPDKDAHTESRSKRR